MFTIKNLVSKITDKGNGQRPGETSASFVTDEEQHSAEGFLCPPCMRAFSSAEALEEHYLKAHPIGGDSQPNTTPDTDDIQFLRQQIENLQTSLVEEKSMSEELKKEVMKIQTEFYKKDDNGTTNIQDQLEQNNALLKSEINLLRQQLTDELEQTSQLRKDKELLKEKLLSLVDENDAAKLENKSLQAQLNHRNSVDDAAVLRQELVSVQRMMNQATLEKESQIEELNVKIGEMENSLVEARRQSEAYITRIEELQEFRNQHANLKKELADNVEALYEKDSEIEHLKGLLQTKEKFESLQAQSSQLLLQEEENLTDSSKLEDPNEGQQQDPEALKVELEAAQSQNLELSKIVHNLKLEVESYQSSMKQQAEEHALNKRNLNAHHVDLQEQLKKRDDEICQLIKAADDSQKLVQSKVEKINELNNAVTSLTDGITEKNKVLEKLQETKADEKNKFLQQIGALNTTLSNQETELKAVQTRVQQLSQELKEKLSEISKLTTELQEAHSLNQTKSEKLLSLENELKSAQDLVSKTKENLASTITESSSKMKKITQDYESRLNSSEAVLVETKAKIEELNNTLTKKVHEIEHLQKTVDENSTLVSDKISKITSLETQIQEMEFFNIELKEKLKSSDEEKALLSERCLAEQSKAESSHQAFEECRRKLEDSVAALQELGRENQSLQIDSAKLHSRQWMDDSLVTHCKWCVKEFSLTIRKHHCRQCGQVFCNDCSSRTASLPSSKKPVRVCDACFENCTGSRVVSIDDNH